MPRVFTNRAEVATCLRRVVDTLNEKPYSTFEDLATRAMGVGVQLNLFTRSECLMLESPALEVIVSQFQLEHPEIFGKMPYNEQKNIDLLFDQLKPGSKLRDVRMILH